MSDTKPMWKKPMVRGENVTIIEYCEIGAQKQGILGAIDPNACILVSYPDGEMGYVRTDHIQEAP